MDQLFVKCHFAMELEYVGGRREGTAMQISDLQEKRIRKDVPLLLE